jgi:SOS-response transcriptional repressor LexA
MGVKERIFLFIEYVGISKNKFEKMAGLSTGYLKNFKGSLGADKLEGILNVFPELNREWLLNGNGQMLAEREKQFRDAKKDVLPLIPYPAIGGYTEDNWTALLNDCPLYAIPDIKTPADFLIKVGGDSMNPKYQEGDLLACKMIQEILFFQWGKTYVLDTSQGVMVKNVYEDADNKENILLVSENKDKYPPFAIPRSDIRKIALVVGSIRIRMTE